MKGKRIAWILIAAGIVLMLAALSIPDDHVALTALFAGFVVLLVGVVMNERVCCGTATLAWPE
jgi:hypothetical protein